MNLTDIKDVNLPQLDIYLHIVPTKHRCLFLDYIKYISLLAKKCLKENKNQEKSLSLILKATSKTWNNNFLLGRLKQYFIKENLSLSLITEPIEGFSWVAKNLYELDYIKSTPMFLQIISPISRLISVLNNGTPILYQPLSNLIFAYFSLYLKENEDLIKIFKSNKINIDIKAIDKYLENIQLETKYILSLKMNLILKLKLCVLVGAYKQLIAKNNKKINFLFYLNSFLYGLYYTLTIKRKNITSNQL